MGYTHYWYYTPKANDDNTIVKWISAVRRIAEYRAAIEKGIGSLPPVKICGGLGKGGPEIGPNHIWFNGDISAQLDHETFSVDMLGNGREKGFGFCKTRRQPYDTLVGLSLIALDEEIDCRSVFKYSSDGDKDDWETITAAYQVLHGKCPVLRFYK